LLYNVHLNNEGSFIMTTRSKISTAKAPKFTPNEAKFIALCASLAVVQAAEGVGIGKFSPEFRARLTELSGNGDIQDVAVVHLTSAADVEAFVTSILDQAKA
jgi:hypothetical protein